MCPLVEDNTFWKFEASIKEKLSNSLARPTRIFLGHERVLAVDDGVFDLG